MMLEHALLRTGDHYPPCALGAGNFSDSPRNVEVNHRYIMECTIFLGIIPNEETWSKIGRSPNVVVTERRGAARLSTSEEPHVVYVVYPFYTRSTLYGCALDRPQSLNHFLPLTISLQAQSQWLLNETYWPVIWPLYLKKPFATLQSLCSHGR